MFLFYAEEGDGVIYELLESEAIHCGQVLRKEIGDVISFTDGKGNAFQGEIVSKQKKRIGLKVLEEIELQKKRKYKVHIAIAPTKNINRFEWFLEKATELGIDEITPIISEHSERKVIKIDRCQKILISAMKQSLKSTLPQLNQLVKFEKFLKTEVSGQKFIAHLEEGTKDLIKLYQKDEDATILIGPEGDFSQDEINKAKQFDYLSASLGDYRLRTETAGISAVQAIHFVNQI